MHTVRLGQGRNILNPGHQLLVPRGCRMKAWNLYRNLGSHGHAPLSALEK
jgi:hypothetical protein